MKTVVSLTCLIVVVLLSGCYKSGGPDPDGSDTHSDTVPDTHPDVMPDPVHDTWPDFEPDVPPDVYPDVYPDIPPDVFPDTPGCMDNSHCPLAEDFCEFPAGLCIGPGVCIARPGACPGIYDPVCGCDGVTYGNDCTRQAAGMQLMHRGECDSEPCFPGDPYGVCDPGEFCEGPEGMCDMEGPTGWCEPIPSFCPELWAPVCGCDNVTYANDCERQRAGVWRWYRGECSTSPPCMRGDPTGVCGPEEFCEGPAGMCDVIGSPGWCQMPDDDCGWLYDPVCGCNEVTYNNDCERQRAGVWLDYWGPCEITPERPCGPFYPPCASSEFCEFPPGDCGWGEDPTGICTLRPMECSLIYDPVCGCNGITYGNDCLRQLDGVSLLHRGEC